MKSSCDDSILAWQNPRGVAGSGLLFATSALFFAHCSSVVALPSSDTAKFTLTNRGLETSLELYQCPHDPTRSLILLNCRYEDDYDNRIALSVSNEGGLHVLDYNATSRLWKSRIELVNIVEQQQLLVHGDGLLHTKAATITVLRQRPWIRPGLSCTNNQLLVRVEPANCRLTFHPPDQWNARTRCFTPRTTNAPIQGFHLAAIGVEYGVSLITVCIAYDRQHHALSIVRGQLEHPALENSCLKFQENFSQALLKQAGSKFWKCNVHFDIEQQLLAGQQILMLTIKPVSIYKAPRLALDAYEYDGNLTYTYEELPSGGLVRLVKLWPAENVDADLDLEFITLDMCSFHCSWEAITFHTKDHEAMSVRNLTYDVLSLSWEVQPWDNEVRVHSNEGLVSLAVPETLVHALKVLRSSRNIRYLWVDVLCINQASANEKNRQGD